MQVSIAGNPLVAFRATVSRVRGTPLPERLRRVLVDARLRRLERRIEDDLRRLDHDGVSEDYRRASRG
ncbi:MAG TPA: hypothetical protein VKI44_06100 [Acetobacteraceae bacterium]|nr:hypothetical protein [Acetobacteraceae bacterium]